MTNDSRAILDFIKLAERRSGHTVDVRPDRVAEAIMEAAKLMTGISCRGGRGGNGQDAPNP